MYDERWLPRPQLEIIDGLKSYRWKDLEVKVNYKGRSIYATKDISKVLKMPYGGVDLDLEKYSMLLGQDDCSRMSYICIANADRNDVPFQWLDAHHSLQPKNMPMNGSSSIVSTASSKKHFFENGQG